MGNKVIITDLHEALMLHYMMLTRQITSLSDCLLHIIRLHTRGDEDGRLFRGYRAYAQTELADVICQAKKLCETLGLDFRETEIMGDTRYEEKRQEFLKKHPTDPWI